MQVTGFIRVGVGVCLIWGVSLAWIELLIHLTYHSYMKVIKFYLTLCLLLVMPFQSIAAGFQLTCPDSTKASIVVEKKLSHCHQSQEKTYGQSQDNLNKDAGHHCLSFCAQVGMSALTHEHNSLISKEVSVMQSEYLFNYYSFISPQIQKPPILIS